MGKAQQVRYKTYSSYIENAPPEVAANTMLCLVHQTNYLLDQQLRQLEQAFLEEGGFTERLYKAREQSRQPDRSAAPPSRSYQSTAAPPKKGVAEPKSPHRP